VGPDHPYANIQDAVNDASPGSIIYVYPADDPGYYPEGYYNESVSITKNNLQIIAQGSGVKVIPTVGGDPSFGVYADHVVIRGFEMTGPDISMGIQFEGSHNIFADNTIHPTYKDDVNAIVSRETGGSDYNTIENNTIYDAGFGIRMVVPPEDLNKGNIIRNNTFYDVDYGITVMNGDGFRISENNIITNSGDGICIQIIADNNGVQGYHRITNNTLKDCQEGIALYADNNTTLRNNLISANEVHSAGRNGIFLFADPDAKLKNNSIIKNKVSECGGTGLYLMPLADNNRIIKNSFLRNDVLGIGVNGNNNLIIGNTALNNGECDLADGGTNNKWINNNYENANW